MLNNERRIHCYTSQQLRRGLAVVAFITMLAACALASAAEGLRGSPALDLHGRAALPFVGLTAKAYEDAATVVVQVATVEELYAAVNNPANAGAAIVLAPGTYALSANGPGGAPRPNGGRLELQPDMSLYGLAGDRSAVVINTAALPVASFNAPFGRTGSIRMGRGSNAVEWLTIIGNPAAAAGIATELAGTPTTQIRVAHVVSGGSSRGVDIRNAGAAMAGRRIEAEIVDNDFSASANAAGTKEAIRIANFVGADGGQIYALMSGNRAHDTDLGCIIANNQSSSAVVDVRSNGDIFEHNGVGCVVAGAINRMGANLTNSNSTAFEAHGTKFVDNTGLPAFGGDGITAFGVDGQTANQSSNNALQIRLWGCTFSGNQNTDFKAFGARAVVGAGIAGTYNTVTIEMHDVTERVYVAATDSLPSEPAGTNKVIVLPVVKTRDVTVAADDSCAANISPSEVDDGSYDPRDGDALALALDPAGPFGLGAHAVRLTATSSRGVTNSASATVSVVDQTPPVITGASVDKPTLGPPNHKMVDVTVNYAAADNCEAVNAALGVTSNEPVNGADDGDTAPDWEVVDAHHVRLRAERSGQGSGRIYTITITAADSHGNASSQMVTVQVPHN